MCDDVKTRKKILKAMGSQVQLLLESYTKAKDEFAASICPYKVGDRVACKGRVYNGKTVEITSVFCDYDWDRDGSYCWAVTGYVVNANGKAGVMLARWSQRDEQE